jgi:hypothetical protein
MSLRLGSIHLRRWVTSVRTCAIPELASSLSRIHQLPRLETINLTFFPAGVHGVDFDDEGRLALQASILGALTDSFSIRAPSKLTSLSLHNLRTWDLTPLESAPFQAVLKNLRRLRLSVLYDHADDLFKSLDRWLHFWGTLFHRSILAPTQHTITELTLESHMIPAGALSGLSLVGLQFPHLCALSLRKIVFELSVGVESFILRHAATLACLELITCKLPLNTESNARPIHWAHIWDSFAEGLTALVALRVDETGAGESWERRYVRPAGVNYCGIHAPEHVNVADGAALRRFYATVSARSEEASKTFQGAEGGA